MQLTPERDPAVAPCIEQGPGVFVLTEALFVVRLALRYDSPHLKT